MSFPCWPNLPKVLLIVVTTSTLCGCQKSSNPQAAPQLPRSNTHPKTKLVDSKLPKEYIQTVDFLRDHGLNELGTNFVHAEAYVPDPPHLTLRKQVIAGWMQPRTDSGDATVIGLDGIAYITSGQATPADPLNDFNEFWLNPNRQTFSPIEFFASPLAPGMLLLANRAHQSEQLISFGSHATKTPNFVAVTREFLLKQWNLAVLEHASGDFLHAFRLSVQLQKNRSAFETQARKVLGEDWIKQMSQPSMGGTGTFVAYPFLDGVEDLVNDCARRLNQSSLPTAKPKIVDPLQAAIEPLDSFPSKILKNLDPNFWMQDPILVNLVKVERPILKDLLDAMDSDSRLTLAVRFDVKTGIVQPVYVRDVIRLGIGELLHWKNIANMNGQPATSQQIRQYIQKYGLGTVADDWFNTLANDQATNQQWLDAAKNLLTVDPHPEPNAKPVFGPVQRSLGPILYAEKVKDRSNPNLTELLKNRVQALLDEGDQTPDQPPVDALRMAILLYKYSQPESLPLLSKASANTMGATIQNSKLIYKLLVMAIDDRTIQNDKSALYEYVQWLSGLKGPEVVLTGSIIFEPLIRFGSLSELDGVMSHLFAGNDSALSLVNLSKLPPPNNGLREIILSELIKEPVIQDGIQSLLNDQSSLGSVTVDDSTTYSLVLKNSPQLISRHLEGLAKDPLCPKPGDHREYRVCDEVAEILSELPGASSFRAYWPDSSKNAAIRRAQAIFATQRNVMGALLPTKYRWPEAK